MGYITGEQTNLKGESVLKLPAKFILTVTALLALLLGAHSTWAWLNAMDWWTGTVNSDKLFFAIKVPAQLQPAVTWASSKGFEAYYNPFLLIVPVGFILLGLALLGAQSNIHLNYRLPRWLSWLW